MSEWISVKDRLPDAYTYVLAVCDREVVVAMLGIYGKWWAADDLDIYPTHWMPLPEPPK